jgi:PII-like signaling protein
MRTQSKAQVLRVYVGEEDQFHGGLLYPVIVGKLKEIGIAGVSVFRGTEGYGSHGQLHTVRFENLFQGLPVVIEAVDIEERIALATAALDSIIVEGLYTVQDVKATRFIKDPKSEHPGGA